MKAFKTENRRELLSFLWNLLLLAGYVTGAALLGKQAMATSLSTPIGKMFIVFSLMFAIRSLHFLWQLKYSFKRMKQV